MAGVAGLSLLDLALPSGHSNLCDLPMDGSALCIYEPAQWQYTC